MLRVLRVSYSLPDRQLFEDVSFDVSPGERVGLIGRNGEGKTTLLRLITGELAPESGRVELAPGARLGYLRQGVLEQPGAAAVDVLGPAGEAWRWQQGVKAIDDALGQEGTDPRLLLARRDEARDRLDEAGGEEAARAAHAALAGLGLAEIRPDTPVERLSGGQRTRLALVRLLLEQPDLLLLDEPTNHLDLAGILWLEGFLRRLPGAVLLVSHDRVFLDQTVSRLLALEHGGVRSYPGGYQAYQDARQSAEATQWQTYRRQERQREQIEEQLRRDTERARRTELTTIDFGLRAKAKKGARQAKVKERRLERRIQSTEWVEKPQSAWEVRLDFSATPPSSRQTLEAQGLRLSYGARAILRGVDLRIQAGERIVLTGPNGSGKSTLLRLLSGDSAPDAGSVRPGERTRIGYLQQDQTDLPPDATPLRLLRETAPLDETAARGYLHFFLFTGDQPFTPIGQLSYGERARLSLALLLVSGVNLLLLDEPLNHLDIPARERLERALIEFPGTSLTVAHDRAFIRNVATRILTLEDGMLLEESGPAPAARANP